MNRTQWISRIGASLLISSVALGQETVKRGEAEFELGVRPRFTGGGGAGGGAVAGPQVSAGGTFELVSVIGQVDAGTFAGGSFALEGGLLAGCAACTTASRLRSS